MSNITITIDGNNMANKDKFYDEVNAKIANNFDGFGRNLDAFNDILRGGFGVFEDDDKVILKWKNFAKAKSTLAGLMEDILEIIGEHEHITLMTILGDE